MAGLATEIRGNWILSIKTGSNTGFHVDLFIVVYGSAVILFALLTAIEVASFAKRATSRAHLTISCCAIGIISRGTGCETAVCNSEKVITYCAKIALSAVSWRHWASYALYSTGLTSVGIPCPFKLTHRTLEWTDHVTDVEIIRQGIGGITGIYCITTSLALKEWWPSTH